MRIVGVERVPYKLRLARPVRTARGLFVRREGTLVRLRTDAGLVGHGDAATWPGFGAGEEAAQADLATLASSLRGAALNHPADVPSLRDAVLGTMPELDALIAERTPEVAHAVELACLDLLAQSHGIPLSALFCSQPLLRVPVHALVSNAVQAMDAVRHGARAIKVKIGTLGMGDEGVRLGAMRSAIGPHIGLRLDANGAWHPEAACRAARLLSAYTPDWLEQPVAGGDVEGLAAARKASTVPIAADESVQTMAQLEAIIAADAADIIVIKPMFAGGLRAAAALHARAAQAGLRSVITHAMESAVGRLGALHLAAAVPPGVAHGLGNPLAEDVAAGPAIAGYVAAVPRGPGLGVSIPIVGAHAAPAPRAAKSAEAQP